MKSRQQQAEAAPGAAEPPTAAPQTTEPPTAAPQTTEPEAADSEATEATTAPPPREEGEAPDDGDLPRGLELAPEPVQDGAEELEALKRERDELKDQLLRRRADFENFRKRVERDRPLIRREVAASIMQGLLPTIDSLDHALGADAGEDSIRQGVELTRRELLAALEAEGVIVVNPEGERFDPQRHQALVHEEVPGHEDGAIIEVLRKGYVLEGRLLRPALVKVAKKQDNPAEGTPEPVH